MELVFILLGLVLLDLAAMRWGADSVEGVDNGEWSRRKYWRGLARR
jgi:hypothetical protein